MLRKFSFLSVVGVMGVLMLTGRAQGWRKPFYMMRVFEARTDNAFCQQPASILISYAFVGFIVWVVMCALGEMAAWLPLPSGFTGYAVRFCDPALGFAMGYS